jgi:hypothetical protein
MEMEVEVAAAVMMGVMGRVENGDNGDRSGRNSTDWEIE